MILKTLHYMWFGGKQMPSICKECIESWHKVLPPDWSFQFWNEDNYDVETKNNFVLQSGTSESQSEIGGALQKSQIMFHVKHQRYEKGIV